MYKCDGDGAGDYLHGFHVANQSQQAAGTRGTNDDDNINALIPHKNNNANIMHNCISPERQNMHHWISPSSEKYTLGFPERRRKCAIEFPNAAKNAPLYFTTHAQTNKRSKRYSQPDEMMD